LLYLLNLAKEVARFMDGVQQEVHCTAANQSITGGNFFRQLILTDFRGASSTEQGLCSEPDIAFHTTTAQRTHATTVSANKKFGAGLLGRRAIGLNHSG
jgi:hypothetical protein